jgi:hypothetical protein
VTLAGRVGLALLGVVVAAGIGLAASRLVSQPIGLSGEPVSAGGDLAPAPARPARAPHGPGGTTQPTETRDTPGVQSDDDGDDRGEEGDEERDGGRDDDD